GSHQKRPHMPRERAKLADAEIARIAEWIDLGAPYDRPLVGKDDASAWTQKVLPADAKKHWAFQPLTNPTPPFGREPKASTHPIDAFVSAKLGEHSFVLNPLADKRTLIRRVYLDLIGLPPTLEEVDAFLKDDSPGAYEKVVDRLLASPHHGERWARHWLDLAPFPESH